MSRVAASPGRVLAVCVGEGGIPKLPVPVARVGESGVEGDGHRFRFHGGLDRAVCLFSIEDYRALRRDGVSVEAPGAFGENVLIEGLEFQELLPGDLLAIGERVVLEVFDVREPCGTLQKIDPRFPNLMVGRSGFVCRVRAGGELRPGQAVEHRPATEPAPDARHARGDGPSERCPSG